MATPVTTDLSLFGTPGGVFTFTPKESAIAKAMMVSKVELVDSRKVGKTELIDSMKAEVTLVC